MDQYYEYRHVVEFDEIDHAGNVYSVNFARWQDRCREMFLFAHAPAVLDGLRGDLKLVTVEQGHECLTGIKAFDELSVRMSVEDLTPTTVDLTFDYVCISGGARELLAKGWQRVVCALGADDAAVPRRIAECLIPEPLRLALDGYVVGGPGAWVLPGSTARRGHGVRGVPWPIHLSQVGDIR